MEVNRHRPHGLKGYDQVGVAPHGRVARQVRRVTRDRQPAAPRSAGTSSCSGIEVCALELNLKVVPRVRAVERLVAERKIGDNISFYRGFQQWPLEPRRITQVASSDVTRIIEPNPSQNVATECFYKAKTFAHATRAARTYLDPRRSAWQAIEDLLDQGNTLLDLAYADPDARVHIAFLKDRHFKFEIVVRRISDRSARIKRPAGSASDIAAGAELACQRRF